MRDAVGWWIKAAVDNPTFHDRTGSKEHKRLPDARLDFLKSFPQGFEDTLYFEEERGYKLVAHRLPWELLEPKIFAELLSNEDYVEICKRALQVVNKTNLILPNEKMGLKDGLKTEENMELFAVRLFALLYGEGDFSGRFAEFANCLESINAAKWTTMTYFPYLAFPEEHMFLKPEITKHAAALTRAELN